MNGKYLMMLIGLCLIHQTTFAQFTGTNPSILNDNGAIRENLIIGATGFPSWPAPRRLNLFRSFSGSPASGAPLSAFTTGLKITHRYTPSASSSAVNYNWEVAASNRKMYFHFSNTNRTLMCLQNDGMVGVATTAPDATLHVKNVNGTRIDAHLEGFTLMDGNQVSLLLGQETGAPYGEWGMEYNTGAGGLNFWKPSGATTGGGNYHLFIKDNGKVSIGLDPLSSTTFNGDYKLYVDRGILTEKVKVALKESSDWADYVFDEDYILMPLSEVEAFVTEHHHLPGVPSAEEVQKNGIDVATMDAKLLEKIEELTLHIIELEKKYNDLKATLESSKH